jgi:hypothetical protein
MIRKFFYVFEKKKHLAPAVAQVWISSLVFARTEGTRLTILLWNRLYSTGQASSSNPSLIFLGQIVSWFVSVIIHTIIYMAQAKPWLREAKEIRTWATEQGEVRGRASKDSLCSLKLISHGIVVFPQNKSANNIFSHSFLAKRSNEFSKLMFYFLCFCTLVQ